MKKFEARLYSREGVLYVRYYAKDKLKRRSLQLADTERNRQYAYRNILPEIEKNVMCGGSGEQGEFYISKFIDKVLSKTKKTRKPATLELYEMAAKKFYDYFGSDVDVMDFTVVMLDDWIDSLSEQGISANTIYVYIAPIRLAFKQAMRQELISRNPVSLAEKPKREGKKSKVLNVLQTQTLLRKAEGELEIFLNIAFFTGARSGEVLALEWEDIDFVNGTITISKTLNSQGETQLPKSNKERMIPMLPKLAEFLYAKQGAGRILSVTYNTMLNRFGRLQDECGFEDRVTLHVTRHTFTSLMIEAQEKPTLIQQFLGHSSMDMINNIYAHYIKSKEDGKKYMELFEGVN